MRSCCVFDLLSKQQLGRQIERRQLINIGKVPVGPLVFGLPLNCKGEEGFPVSVAAASHSFELMGQHCTTLERRIPLILIQNQPQMYEIPPAQSFSTSTLQTFWAGLFFIMGAVQGIAECLAACRLCLLDGRRNLLNCDNPKCLQIFTDIPWEAEQSPFENHLY